MKPAAGALFALAALGALAAPAEAEPVRVFGYGGPLGEWELTADVAESASARARELRGAVIMTHVGLCTQDGPEQRKGEISIEMIGSGSRLTAKMLLDGAACSYAATLSDAYKGTMTCPERPAMPLTLWVR
ncbi:MAG: hypothetical protein V7604_2559 [Hyphomicrobiales bacterium]